MKAVHFRALRPMLQTRELESTIDFYTKFLGFRCDALNREYGWASLNRDSVELMVTVPNGHMPFDSPTFTGSLYFNVDDAAALWVSLKDVDFHYGMREFAIYDNNGYMLLGEKKGPDVSSPFFLGKKGNDTSGPFFLC